MHGVFAFPLIVKGVKTRCGNHSVEQKCSLHVVFNQSVAAEYSKTQCDEHFFLQEEPKTRCKDIPVDIKKPVAQCSGSFCFVKSTKHSVVEPCSEQNHILAISASVSLITSNAA